MTGCCCGQLAAVREALEDIASRTGIGGASYVAQRALAALSADSIGECPHKAGIVEILAISDSYGPRQTLPLWADERLRVLADPAK